MSEREYTGGPVPTPNYPERPTATGTIGGLSVGQAMAPGSPLDTLLNQVQSMSEMLHPQLDTLITKLDPIMAPQQPAPEPPAVPEQRHGSSSYAARLVMVVSDLERLRDKIVDAQVRLEI